MNRRHRTSIGALLVLQRIKDGKQRCFRQRLCRLLLVLSMAGGLSADAARRLGATIKGYLVAWLRTRLAAGALRHLWTMALRGKAHQT